MFVDRYTGTDASRPEWDRAKDHLRSGGTLIVTRLDWLGRSTKDLLKISQWLRDQDVDLQVTKQPIDTTTAEGKMSFVIMAAMAEIEHELIVARTRDGLAAARARGRLGRVKAKVTEVHDTRMVRSWRALLPPSMSYDQRRTEHSK